MSKKWANRLRVGWIALFLVLTACAQAQPTADPAAGRTGIPELDRIIEIVLAGDLDEVRSLIQFTQTACTNIEGLGGPPKCLANEAPGTPVEVLPLLGPEGHFIRKAEIQSWDGLQVSQLFAAYQVSDQAYTDLNYPAGEYALVFIGGLENQTSLTLQVRGGRIVRIDESLQFPPVLREEDVVKYLVEPGVNP
ncbi:MAG: hypothetical protein K8S20_11900 [Chloroflexi bacterium]|nr:hypothetical protein [Chloroflexota bacterium]